MKIAAVVLIVVGVIALAYGGIGYTRDKKVLDIGGIQATTRTRETIPCRLFLAWRRSPEASARELKE
jgi:hypothetical protein